MYDVPSDPNLMASPGKNKYLFIWITLALCLGQTPTVSSKITIISSEPRSTSRSFVMVPSASLDEATRPLNRAPDGSNSRAISAA